VPHASGVSKLEVWIFAHKTIEKLTLNETSGKTSFW
jgi:hypothetical protein